MRSARTHLPNPSDTIFATSATRRLSLAAGAATATLAFVALRLVSTRSHLVTREEARVGRATTDVAFDATAFARALDAALIVLVPLLALAVGVLLLRRWRAGERRLALVGLGTIGGAVLTAEALKALLAARASIPDRLNEGFPSGHTTTAVATVLAYAAAVRLPGSVGRGAVYAAFVAAGVVVDGWHLPSDVLGGILLACAWFLGLVALLEPGLRLDLRREDVVRAAAGGAVVTGALALHLFLPAHGGVSHRTAAVVAVLAAAAVAAPLLVAWLTRRA